MIFFNSKWLKDFKNKKSSKKLKNDEEEFVHEIYNWTEKQKVENSLKDNQNIHNNKKK